MASARGLGLRMFGVAALAAFLVMPLAAPVLIPDRAPVTSRVLVRFVDGVSVERQTEVLADHGAEVVRRVPELDLVVADIVSATPAWALDALARASGVKSVDGDHLRTAEGSFGTRADDPAWAARRVNSAPIKPAGFATIAILDTGVDVSDPQLTGQMTRGWSALGGDPLHDLNGHGTAMAAIAVAGAADGDRFSGVAPLGAVVLPIQVLDPAGVGRDSDIIRGVVEATLRGADVIFMGFSGPAFSESLQAAIDFAWSRGVVLVAPIGDRAAVDDAPVFPAGSPRVMGVGATTGIDTVWSGSDPGADVFIAAPGLEVPVGVTRTFSGTAAAGAMVAGAAGLLAAADPGVSNATIVGRLARGAAPVAPRENVGNGRIDVTASLADRGEEGLVPLGAITGSGGPFVTEYVPNATPLAGWAREHASMFRDTRMPMGVDGVAMPVLSSSVGGAAPAMSVWHWSLAGDPLADGAVLRQRSFLVETLLDDPLASDHGAFTYGSVSPPAIASGVLS